MGHGDPRILSDRVMLEYEQGDFSQGKFYLKRLLQVHRGLMPGPTTGYVMPALIIPLINRIDHEVAHLDYAYSLAEAVISSASASPLVTSVAKAGPALLAVLRHDETAAVEHYSGLKPICGTMLQTGVISADRLLGLLSQTLGNYDRASEHFEDALAFCRKAGYRPELAWTCHDYAEALFQCNGPGDQSKASSLLDEALSISSELGMRPLMERVIALQERVQSRPEPSPAYPDRLSQREVEVLRPSGRRGPHGSSPWARATQKSPKSFSSAQIPLPTTSLTSSTTSSTRPAPPTAPRRRPTPVETAWPSLCRYQFLAFFGYGVYQARGTGPSGRRGPHGPRPPTPPDVLSVSGGFLY